MILFPLTIVADIALWWWFADVIQQPTADALLAWVAFGLAFTGLFWIVQEGISLAGARFKDGD